MIFRTLRDLAIVALLASGLVGCTSLFGTDGNAPGSNASSQSATDRYSASHSHHAHSRLFPAEDLGDPAPASGSFFSFGSGDFWQHLRHDFQLPTMINQPQVQAQINWFLHNKSYLDHTLRRAQPYMYYILQQVEKRNLPGELVLLPVQESAFNPSATSWAGAVGIWQLMRSTAKDLGVRQDFWFDGRRDIYASTNAALDQLMYLQSYFGGDWMLALAAYNSGEGTVQNAMRRNTVHGKETDFWDLSLPQATRAYIPQLLAIADIIRDPDKYGITLPPVSDKPYLAQVDIGAPISLARAAQLAGLSLDQIKQLNPGYNRMMTDPNGPYKLILPIDRIALFKEQLSTVPSLPKTTWGRYRVQRGDTLTSIAAHYHTSVSELIEANHLRVRRAPVGRVIMIPTGTQQVVPHVDADATDSSTEQNATSNTMSVSNSVSEAAQLAPATDSNEQTTDTRDISADSATTSTAQKHIHTAHHNQKLNNAAKHQHKTTTTKTKAVVHNTTQHKTKTAIRPDHYVIKSGDTIFGISKKLGVKSTNLMKWNRLSANSALKPGERLVVH